LLLQPRKGPASLPSCTCLRQLRPLASPEEPLSQRWQPRAWIFDSDAHRRNQVPLRQNDLTSATKYPHFAALQVRAAMSSPARKSTVLKNLPRR
jgi:hypothetical protein